MTKEAVEGYARGFLMFLLGTTIFAAGANTVPLCLLSALVDVRQILHYDWGGAALAALYGYMSLASRGNGQLLGGYWRAWEVRSFPLFISAFLSSVLCTVFCIAHTVGYFSLTVYCTHGTHIHSALH